jgi:hypothetical protein
MKEYVYEFIYCDCVWESSYATVSLHRTKLGAYKAMRKFIYDMAVEHEDSRTKYGKDRLIDFRWNFSKGYGIRKVEIND